MLLSRRESQVVELMGKGLSRADISDRLKVSRKCVSVFIERARAKFRLKASLQLRHLAFRMAISAGKQPRQISPSIFIAGMMPESANPVQHHATIIEIRPSRAAQFRA
jgi:DNA-binding CsgD family transcriptional regulator